MLREEYRQRLAVEYRYAVNKMQEAQQAAQKLFYFSVFFGEAQRVLNWEWNADLVLIYTITQHTHTQLNAITQMPGLPALPIDWTAVFDKLIEASSDLATYLENLKDAENRGELCQILERFAEIAYAVSGNGSYLTEKGVFKI